MSYDEEEHWSSSYLVLFCVVGHGATERLPSATKRPVISSWKHRLMVISLAESFALSSAFQSPSLLIESHALVESTNTQSRGASPV